jgi:signal transduction histidine kinase
MRGAFAYRRRRRLPAPTARLRLTLLYAGMLLILGAAAFGLTYALTSHSPTIAVAHATPSVTVTPTPAPRSAAGAIVSRRRLFGPAGPQGVVVQQHSADQRRLLAVSLLVLALSAIASVALGWFVSGRILRPLRQITTTARTISAGNLSERLALQGPNDEFRQLGDTLDDLLARLESAFEAQRRFVANASHELRTPLTLERTLLQVALADPEAGAAKLRATCQELLASGREHERLLEALLTVASSERGLDHRVPFDLAPLAERAVAAAQLEISRRGLAVVTTLAAAPATGDPILAERLATNLVDNAVRYNLPDGRIEVHTAADRAHAVLTVTNTGPVISPWDIERLFEPFQRLGPGRTGAHDSHHGLGLSIVRAIAEAHDGSVVARPQPTGGLAVTVTLPRGPAPSRMPPVPA